MFAGLQRSLALYYALSFLITALIWIVGSAISSCMETGDVYAVKTVAGAAVPFFVALGMTLASGSRELPRDFSRKLLDLTPLNRDMLPAVLLLMPMVVVTSVLLSLLIGEPVSQFLLAQTFFTHYGVFPAVVVLLLSAVLQEVGWRGYAFPGLRSRHSLPTASLLFGTLWALWHFPLLFFAGTPPYEAFQQSPWYALNFYLGIIPVGVLISWFCAINGGSIVAATLFHFSVVLSRELLAVTPVTRVIETVILAAVAAVVVTTVPLELHAGSYHSNSYN
jgi:uncharacterized protein